MPTYDAFISYSHQSDRLTAPALQTGLENLNRRWLRPRPLRVFRDETDLSVSPSLWSAIEQALDQSRFLVLLASPQAAQSKWVRKEVDHWLHSKPPQTILLIVTDGSFAWDDVRRDFDPAASTAIPPALFGVYQDEPLLLDLRAVDLHQRRSSEFQRMIARLAAPIHGKSLEELLGIEVQIYRRRLGATVAVLASIAVLAAVALWQYAEANRQRDIAVTERNRVQHQLLAARSTLALDRQQASPAFWLAAEAWGSEADWMSQKALYDYARTGLLTTFNHGTPVTHAAISNDGQRVLTMGVGFRVWKADGTPVFDRGLAGAISGGFAEFTGAGEVLQLESSEIRVFDSKGTLRLKIRVEGFLSHGGAAPDGSYFLTASSGEPLRRWDADGKLLTEYPTRTRVEAVAISPDGSQVVASTRGGDVVVWGTDGKVRQVIHVPSSTQHMEFGPDGETLLAVTGARELKVWRIDTGKVEFSEPNVISAAFDADGSRFAIQSDRGLVRVIDLRRKTERILAVDAHVAWRPASNALNALQAPEGLSSMGKVLRFADKGRVLVGALESGARVWDVDTGDVLRSVPNRRVLAGLGSTMLTTGDDSALLWELESAVGVRIGLGAPISSIDFPSSGQDFVAAGLDGKAMLWDSRKKVLEVLDLSTPLNAARFSADGDRLLFVGRGPNALLWRRSDGTSVVLPHGDSVEDGGFSPDGERVFTASSDGTVGLWTANGEPLAKLEHPGAVYRIVHSPNGRWLATATVDRLVSCWNDSLEVIWKWTAPEAVRTLSFSTDGAHLLVVSSGKEASLLDARSGRLLVSLPHPDEVVSGSVGRGNPGQGNLIVTSSADRIVRLWNFAGKLLATMPHEQRVDSVEISSDGLRVLTSSRDGRARLWDSSGNELMSFVHGAGLRFAAIAPEGDRIVTVSNQQARIWEFGSPASIIARYRNKVRPWNAVSKQRADEVGCTEDQNRKYRCAIGCTATGSQVSSTPSARTS